MRESVSARIDAPAPRVFARVIDVARLVEWNDAIGEIIDAPSELEPGSVWKVRIHALGRSWVSKSTLSELDAETGRFCYRSQSDDGNPSYADWEWRVRADGDASAVTVTVDLHPVTFWRKYLLVRLRRPSLRKEMRSSLAALSAAVTH